MKGFMVVVLLACCTPLDGVAQRVLVTAGQSAGGGFNQAGSLTMVATVGALKLAPATFMTTVAVEEEAGVPTTYALGQNYPNPFNPTTSVSYALPVAGPVRLVVYNLLGQEVAVLVDATQPSGRHTVTFEATGLPSGLYYYRIETDKYRETRSMMLLK